MATAFEGQLASAAVAQVGGHARNSMPSAGSGDAGPLLSAFGIVKSYRRGLWPGRRRVDVLRGAELVLQPGEIVGLVGENGSGKSTLMKILVGALDRDAGVVVRDGSIGYCPQETVLYERLTCDEHFELFGRAYGMDSASVADARAGIYDVLGFASYQGTRVEELSGGTRAKLNLGLALLPDPGVLLLDEPYAGFDWETYQRFWEVARYRRDRGRAVLIVSHFVADGDRFDRIVHLADGKTASA